MRAGRRAFAWLADGMGVALVCGVVACSSAAPSDLLVPHSSQAEKKKDASASQGGHDASVHDAHGGDSDASAGDDATAPDDSGSGDDVALDDGGTGEAGPVESGGCDPATCPKCAFASPGCCSTAGACGCNFGAICL
jgi:hypothetical protein